LAAFPRVTGNPQGAVQGGRFAGENGRFCAVEQKIFEASAIGGGVSKSRRRERRRTSPLV